jgi:hypothetical protein
MNNTGTKQGSIMNKWHFEGKNGNYATCLKYLLWIFAE